MRLKTLHGIVIPPKQPKGRTTGNSITLDFVITGTIPSKKNRQIATMNYNKIIAQFKQNAVQGALPIGLAAQILKENKPYIRHSKNFQAWEEKTKEKILAQAATWNARLSSKGYEAIFPIPDASIKIYHYWKDWKKRDNSNKAETLHDLFVSAGILHDDSWQSLSPNEADAGCYAEEITNHITLITITAYGWLKKNR